MGTPSVPAVVGEAALEAAKGFARQSFAERTRRAYAFDWEDFSAFCRASGFGALPAEPRTVAAYLASLAPTHAPTTIRRRLAAIGQAHRLSGHEWIPSHPVIRATLRGLLRRHGRPRRQAAALGTAELRRLVGACDDGLTGKRDRALLLLGFAAALRRSELVALRREDLSFDQSGLRVLIRRSKTDPDGEGVEIGVSRGSKRHTCPVRALEDWLQASGCRYGPIFCKVDLWGHVGTEPLHPDSVAVILRQCAKRAELALPAGARLSPHGLRAGFITEAYLAGVRDEAIMEHTRHKDLKTMRGYVRRARLVSESPTKALDL